ncbi:uncharacterized protein UHOD_12391 [Ustilago sp. UG-2017b]|nr:uncharacterized protein UHOD_12391 [Ustilago sp. UG-2017b]
MKLNIAIVALALSSSVLTLAAPFPKPMPQGGSSWSILKNAVGKFSGKSKSAAQPTSIYADEYIPQYPELSDASHPYIPKEHRASGGESSSKSGNQHSPEASPVHRSHGGGDSSRPAERDPRHGGDESGHSTSPPDEKYVGMIKLSPPDTYYGPQYTPHIPQHYPYIPQHYPYIPQHYPYITQHDPYIPQNTHAGPYPPPGEIVPLHSPHDVYGYPFGEYHSRSPPRQNGVGWYS